MATTMAAMATPVAGHSQGERLIETKEETSYWPVYIMIFITVFVAVFLLRSSLQSA